MSSLERYLNYGKNMVSIYFVYNSCFCLGIQDGNEEKYEHKYEEWKDNEESEDWELKTTTDILFCVCTFTLFIKKLSTVKMCFLSYLKL